MLNKAIGQDEMISLILNVLGYGALELLSLIITLYANWFLLINSTIVRAGKTSEQRSNQDGGLVRVSDVVLVGVLRL
ncbi:hypothetical protein ON010_g2467 [Phytophthora cinnamomi]|nr:hypothetical protein ON010_g2467 [Phytophthora cinnamomi]